MHWIVVLVIFACTGYTLKFMIQGLCLLLNIEKYSWLYWVSWFFPGLIVYQFVLLGYAWIFGKYAYFLEKKKRMWNRIKGWMGRKSADKIDEESPS